MTPGTKSLHGLTLLLSGRCNAACAYCYQDARRGPARMAWPLARAALDFLLAHGRPPLTVEFSGGEPLLEPELLRRCVRHVERHRRSDPPVRFVVTTNGLLLAPEVLEFIVAHDVALRLSFDGVRAAQDARAPDAFDRLDRLLDAIRKAHPRYFRDRVRIQAVLRPSTVPHLAESARYFLEKGVQEVAFYPAAGRDGIWRGGDVRRLESQTARVTRDSLRHWASTQTVPVLFLRDGARPGGSGESRSSFLCGAGYGKGLCVDTGGTVWTCPLFASSLQALSPLARHVSDAVDLGDVRDPALALRLASLPKATGRLPVLTRRLDKYSTHGACRDCEFLDDCVPCPAAVSHAPGDGDPHRIPDFLCAFNRATLSARRDFQARAREILSGLR